MADGVLLESFTFDTIVGITDGEQRRTQPIRIDVVMSFDPEPAARGDLSQTIDYASVYEQILTLVQYGQWRLIETIAVGIARLVLAPPAPADRRTQVERVEVTVRKPTILPGATPGVRLTRDAPWCELDTRLLPPRTWVDTIVETEQAGAWRLHVESGTAWSIPPGAAVLLIAGEASADGEVMAPLQRLARGQCTRLEALGSSAATVLVVGPKGILG